MIESRQAAGSRSGSASLYSLAVALGLTSAAFAQQQPEQSATTPAGVQSLDEVTVTGSRIRRTTDFDTANPTTVVDASYLQNLGMVNVSDAIEQLPSNVSTFSATNTGNSAFFAGSTIANLRGLNPFFGSRTLNLVNNRRFVPTNQGDGVDLNFIPSVLIDRVDVVTGGASAAYGSGAISGVNNIFLNRTLEGGRLDVDFYQTAESDGDDKHVGVAYGTRLFGDRAHLVLGYEFQDSDPVGCFEARSWCARGMGFRQNVAGPDSPSLVLAGDLRQNQVTTGGVFNNGAPGPGNMTAIQVNPDGRSTSTFNIGSGLNGVPFNVVEGGDGRSIYQFTNLRAPVKRHVATGVFSVALTDTIDLNVDLSWGNVETLNDGGGPDSNFIQIQPDNAYLQGNPALQAAYDAASAGGPFAFFNKNWDAQVNAFNNTTTKVKRAAIGLDGQFGASTWTWDTYFQYGETVREQFVADNIHLNATTLALDSVLDANGNPVCRVTRDGAPAANLGLIFDERIAQGCVPINPFGTAPLPQAARDYVFGFLRENLKYEQQVLAANATGDLFDGFGAGAIQGAIGLEYRTEKGRNIAAEEIDPWDRTDFLVQYGESFSGDVDVTEGFAEVNLPLLRDRPGAKRLEVNVAARQSRYENKGLAGTTGETRSHNMFTWKLSTFWDPVDWLRLRGSRSRDSRAANFRELYYGQKIMAGGLFGFCEQPGAAVRDACNWSLEGNVDLKPEKADTTTIGFVFTPRDTLRGFQFAADYFSIEISDAIQQASIQRVRDGCVLSGIDEFCDLISFGDPAQVDPADPLSNITDIRALSFNGSGYEYKGIDFTGSYELDLGNASSLYFRLLATRMIDQNFQPTPGQPFVNVVGQTGTGNSFLSDNQPTADWRGALSATWNRGPLSFTGQMQYVSGGIMDYNGITPGDPRFSSPPPGTRTVNTNRVPSYQVFTLSGSYRFDGVGPLSSLQLFATVDNLFDKEPPVAPGGGAFGPSNDNGGTNAVFFDTLGRSYRVGLRTRF